MHKKAEERRNTSPTSFAPGFRSSAAALPINGRPPAESNGDYSLAAESPQKHSAEALVESAYRDLQQVSNGTRAGAESSGKKSEAAVDASPERRTDQRPPEGPSSRRVSARPVAPAADSGSAAGHVARDAQIPTDKRASPYCGRARGAWQLTLSPKAPN